MHLHSSRSGPVSGLPAVVVRLLLALALSAGCGPDDRHGGGGGTSTGDGAGLPDAGDAADASDSNGGACDPAEDPFGCERIVEVAAGGISTCARGETGAVWCWGNNTFGTLGDGLAEREGCEPKMPAQDCSARPVRVRDLPAADQVSVGYTAACALVGGGVRCWGTGPLGDGESHESGCPPAGRGCSTTPVQVVGLSEVTSVAVGSKQACAVTSAQEVWCWGDNRLRAVGDGTDEDRLAPVRVPLGAAVRQVAAGTAFTCALLADETVSCWGLHDKGQLGTGSAETDEDCGVPDRPRPCSSRPLPVQGLAEVAALFACTAHTCARRTDGTVACWGSGSDHALGGESEEDALAPVEVAGLSGKAAASPSCGGANVYFRGDHSCVVLDDDSLWCWGDGGGGQLGNGDHTRSARPVRVALHPAARPVSVSLGGVHSCAALHDGTLWCWGSNLYGEIGDGTFDKRLWPVRIGGAGG